MEGGGLVPRTANDVVDAGYAIQRQSALSVKHSGANEAYK